MNPCGDECGDESIDNIMDAINNNPRCRIDGVIWYKICNNFRQLILQSRAFARTRIFS